MYGIYYGTDSECVMWDRGKKGYVVRIERDDGDML